MPDETCIWYIFIFDLARLAHLSCCSIYPLGYFSVLVLLVSAYGHEGSFCYCSPLYSDKTYAGVWLFADIEEGRALSVRAW